LQVKDTEDVHAAFSRKSQVLTMAAGSGIYAIGRPQSRQYPCSL